MFTLTIGTSPICYGCYIDNPPITVAFGSSLIVDGLGIRFTSTIGTYLSITDTFFIETLSLIVVFGLSLES